MSVLVLLFLPLYWADFWPEFSWVPKKLESLPGIFSKDLVSSSCVVFIGRIFWTDYPRAPNNTGLDYWSMSDYLGAPNNMGLDY
jgi:hypothetical protein